MDSLDGNSRRLGLGRDYRKAPCSDFDRTSIRADLAAIRSPVPSEPSVGSQIRYRAMAGGIR
jgi:hypothetical protein